MPEMLTLHFERERETKRTVRFTETGSPEPVTGTLYVSKAAVSRLGDPDQLEVTIGGPPTP